MSRKMLSDRNLYACRKIGSAHARRLYQYVTFGFHRQFESNDKLGFIRYDPEDCEVWGLELLCDALGLIAVLDGGVELYGRASTLATLQEHLDGGHGIHGQMVRKGFYVNHVYPMAPQTNERLAVVRKRATGIPKIYHKVCEQHPHLRNWDDTLGAEISLLPTGVVDGTIGCDTVFQEYVKV